MHSNGKMNQIFCAQTEWYRITTLFIGSRISLRMSSTHLSNSKSVNPHDRNNGRALPMNSQKFMAINIPTSCIVGSGCQRPLSGASHTLCAMLWKPEPVCGTQSPLSGLSQESMSLHDSIRTPPFDKATRYSSKKRADRPAGPSVAGICSPGAVTRGSSSPNINIPPGRKTRWISFRRSRQSLIYKTQPVASSG
jgi:hypothetical protein